VISGWLRQAARRPLVRRLTGYSAGSLIAAGAGELAFVTTYGWGHAGSTWATAAGFVAAAVPNYVLNRRWAWPDRRGRSRRTEVALYLAVVLVSFAGSAVATHWAAIGAGQVASSRAWQTFLVAGAYLAVSGVFFLLKFGLYETIVFTPAGGAEMADGSGAGGPRAARTTR
jgi:putative flippase GtrA